MVRVALTDEPARSLEVEIDRPFRIHPVGSDTELFAGTKLERTTITATRNGLRIGTRELPATRLEIVSSESPAIWIEEHQYRGRVRLFRQSGGMIQAVNVLPLEEYVACVVDSEMPASFPEEARKAQAIVARTYARYQTRLAGPDAILDLFASTRSQKYLGFQYRERDGRRLAGETAAGRRSAEATAGQVCTWRGELFCAYYCAVCGGSTVQGSDVFSDAAPILKPVPCDWCREARLYRWTAEISKRDLQADLGPLLRRDGKQPGALKTVSLVREKGQGADVLPEFDLRGERDTVRVSGADLRQALSARGLFSPRFTMAEKGQSWLISGRGHGHGVGLCQWGARGLALAGRSCDEILKYYYPGATVGRAP